MSQPRSQNLRAPFAGQVVVALVSPGQVVSAGQVLLVLEAMKMEHELRAEAPARVLAQHVEVGEAVQQDQVLLDLLPLAQSELAAMTEASAPSDPHAPRVDLLRLQERLAATADSARPQAMAKRHAAGGRSARENIAALCDAGSFVEYGALALAAQAQRRSQQDLIANTPADGMVCGVGTVNAAQFGEAASKTVVLAYDATVLAGTQGARNHQKTDRLLELAQSQRLPLVLFAEGGGGRPGDVDMPIVAGLHVPTFASLARLNGRVPLLGIVAGRCFAGNAALAGCCDTLIATANSNLGMGGPAMVEGGGLGVYAPEQIGPATSQSANGVLDLVVADEAAAVVAAQQYLSYFQGRVSQWQAPAAQALRAVVPENRLRVYDSRAALQGLVDVGSLMVLRADFGLGIHTALARIEGHAVGLLANNPQHLGGAIDADAADKAARFMQLCNAHGLPLVSLVDTPGFMVGPEVEQRAQVRHVSRMFIAAGHLRVPFFAVVLRKGYGLGAMAMCAGGFHETVFTIAWPSGEFGAMGLEGAVKLGFRKELEAAPDEAARAALYQQLLAKQYQAGQALNMAATLEIDAVIDPAQTRHWLARGLQSARVKPLSAPRMVDAW